MGSSNNGPFFFPYSVLSQISLVVFITFVLSGYVCALQYEKEKLNWKLKTGDEKKHENRMNGMSSFSIVASKYIRKRLSKLLGLYFVVVLMVFMNIKPSNPSNHPHEIQDTFWKLGNMMSLMNQFSSDYWWPSATGYREFLPYWTMSPLVSFVCFSPFVCEWFHKNNYSWVKLILVVVLSSFVRMFCQQLYGNNNHAVNGLYVYGKSSVFGLMDSFVVGVFVFYRTTIITQDKITVDGREHDDEKDENDENDTNKRKKKRRGKKKKLLVQKIVQKKSSHGRIRTKTPIRITADDVDNNDSSVGKEEGDSYIGRYIYLLLGLLWWMLACTFEDFVDLQLLSRYNACIIVHLAMNISAACLLIGVVYNSRPRFRNMSTTVNSGGTCTSCVTLCVTALYIFLEWVGKCSLSILLVHNIAIETYFLPERNAPSTTENILITRFFTALMLTLLFALVVQRFVRIM